MIVHWFFISLLRITFLLNIFCSKFFSFHILKDFITDQSLRVECEVSILKAHTRTSRSKIRIPIPLHLSLRTPVSILLVIVSSFFFEDDWWPLLAQKKHWKSSERSVCEGIVKKSMRIDSPYHSRGLNVSSRYIALYNSSLSVCVSHRAVILPRSWRLAPS